MPEQSAASTGEDAHGAATRIAVTFARVLTEHDGRFDDGIPSVLPGDEKGMRTAIGQLERAAVGYADRSHAALVGTGTAHSPAYPILVYTRAACDIMRVVLRYARGIIGDERAAHIAAEAVLLSVLVWRLATGSDRQDLITTGLGCCRFEAGRLTGEAEARGRYDEARERHERVRQIDRRGIPDSPTSPGDVTNPCGDASTVRFLLTPDPHDPDNELVDVPGKFELAGGVAPFIEVGGVRCGMTLDKDTGRLSVLVDTGQVRHLRGEIGEALPVLVLVDGEKVFRS